MVARRRLEALIKYSCMSSNGLPSASVVCGIQVPSGCRCHDAVPSSKAMSNNSPISAICAGLVIETSTSTRRSRLRCIRSAEPIPTDGDPSLANQKRRLCSKNRPRMLRTRMLSLTPGTPGRIVQVPRTQRSTGTPAWDAR